MAQYAALVRHWMYAEPSDDPETFADQVASALWLEKRYFETLGKVMGGGK